jgi:hypothetical protein
MRIRVQSESGVQQLGQLVQAYNSANERMDIVYVRVVQPDGQVVAVSPSKDLVVMAAVAPPQTGTRQPSAAATAAGQGTPAAAPSGTGQPSASAQAASKTTPAPAAALSGATSAAPGRSR